MIVGVLVLITEFFRRWAGDGVDGRGLVPGFVVTNGSALFMLAVMVSSFFDGVPVLEALRLSNGGVMFVGNALLLLSTFYVIRACHASMARFAVANDGQFCHHLDGPAQPRRPP